LKELLNISVPDDEFFSFSQGLRMKELIQESNIPFESPKCPLKSGHMNFFENLNRIEEAAFLRK
jgi:hypothetical protein